MADLEDSGGVVVDPLVDMALFFNDPEDKSVELK